MVRMSRKDYATMYGPTTGDRVRLGDTNLVARVERDHAHYGEECRTGLGKTMRDGLAVNAGHTAADGAVDVVLNNAAEASDKLTGELLNHCKSGLAHYKYPRWINFLEELPKTATGKIQRFQLRAE